MNRDGNVPFSLNTADQQQVRPSFAQCLSQESHILRTTNVEHISHAFIALDHQWRVRYVSHQTTQLLERTREELLGNVLWEVLPILVDSPLYRYCHLAVSDGRPAHFEVESPQHGKNFLLYIFPSLDEDEIAVFLSDVTAHTQAEAELHTAKEQLEAILHNINDGIIVQDESCTVIYANEAVARIVGYPSVEAIVREYPLAYFDKFDMTDESGHPLSAEQFPRRRTLQGERNPYVILRLVKKDSQKVRWIRLTSTVVSARDQLPALVITVLQDITQFKELEQRKDDFILHVNHELRTPLTALVGFLELLADHYGKIDQSTRIKFFNQALENCYELTRLINSIMDAAHLANALHPSQPEEFYLAQVVREVLGQLESSMKQTHSLEVQMPEQLLIRADRQGIEQIVRNLLSNAFKYAPPGTPITISAVVSSPEMAVPQEVCIRVQDAGPGIPPSEQSLLFQKFRRLQRDISGSIRGTGLGLYICKQLVEGMGGRIWVESSGQPGEGSRFCFTLPLQTK